MEKRSSKSSSKKKNNKINEQQQQVNGLVLTSSSSSSSSSETNGNPTTTTISTTATDNSKSTSPSFLIMNSSPKTKEESLSTTTKELIQNGVVEEKDDGNVISNHNKTSNIPGEMEELDKNTNTTKARLKHSNGISITQQQQQQQQHISKTNTSLNILNSNTNTSNNKNNNNNHNNNSSSNSHDSLTDKPSNNSSSNSGSSEEDEKLVVNHDNNNDDCKKSEEDDIKETHHTNQCCNGLKDNDDHNEVQHKRLSPKTPNEQDDDESHQEVEGDENRENRITISQEQSSQNNVSLSINSGYLEGEVNEYGIRYVSYKSELQMTGIMKLIQKDLSEPYSVYTYRYFIHNWPRLCFLAMDGDSMVGVIVCKLDVHKQINKRGYIAMLAVDEKYRRKKIGSSLVLRSIRAMAEEDADEIVLETEITNQSALRLYENLGFVRDKRLFRYYLNGVDALRLKLWLK